MRVIAGTAKSIKLVTLEEDTTRPTTDRIKETLFNMIQFDIPNCVFLDLFSGSGAIAIEALSRGAKKGVFVDNNPKAIRCIKENLKRTNFTNRSLVIDKDVLAYIRDLDKAMVFDIIFIDPPYNQELERDVLTALSESTLLHNHSIIIVEASIKTSFDYANDISLKITKEKKYKKNKHVFLKSK